MKSLKPRHLIDEATSVIAEYDAASPHTSGRVKQAVGGLLVADGFVGLENPFDGKSSRPGILGSLVFVLFGSLFMILPPVVFSGGPDTDATTIGRVTSVSGTSTSEACSVVGTFTVGTEVFTTRSRVSSSSNCNRQVGEQIEVDYVAIDPQINKIAGETRFIWIFIGVGALFVVIGLITFALRAASIVFGRRLYYQGKRQADANPATPGDEGMVAAAREKMLVILTGARADLASTAPKPVSPVSPPPSAPAFTASDIVSPVPGWYVTEDGAHLRWFDGGAWTAHVRPLPHPSNQSSTEPLNQV